MSSQRQRPRRRRAAESPSFWGEIKEFWVSGRVFASMVAALFMFVSTFGGCSLPDTIGKGIGKITRPLIPRILPRNWEAKDAIVQIRMANSMCSATIIAPVADDDEYIDLLTAAHCIQVGQTCKVMMKDGREFEARCVTRAAGPDIAWLRAKRPAGQVPALALATMPPPPGTKVWHQGYGIHIPGNRESGTVEAISSDGHKVQFRLSVSPGDSGGGIITDADDRVISPVCCTTRLGGMGTVWGGAPQFAAKIRPERPAASNEVEAVHPIFRGLSSGGVSTCPNGFCPILTVR